MELNENISKGYELRQKIKELESLQEETKKKITDLEAELEVVDAELLEQIKAQGLNEIESNGLYLNKFEKKNIGYTSDSEVMSYLKANGYTNLIKVKTTESLDKNALKKEIKTNSSLHEALNDYIVETLVEYVTVTDTENHKRMLEHIEEGKK